MRDSVFTVQVSIQTQKDSLHHAKLEVWIGEEGKRHAQRVVATNKNIILWNDVVPLVTLLVKLRMSQRKICFPNNPSDLEFALYTDFWAVWPMLLLPHGSMAYVMGELCKQHVSPSIMSHRKSRYFFPFSHKCFSAILSLQLTQNSFTPCMERNTQGSQSLFWAQESYFTDPVPDFRPDLINLSLLEDPSLLSF